MSDWNQRFADAAPALLKSAIDMSAHLMSSEERWEQAYNLLAWGVPWYLSALGSVLDTRQAIAAIPGFLHQLRLAVEVQGEVDETFPLSRFLALIDEMATHYHDHFPGRTALEAPPSDEGEDAPGSRSAADLDLHIAEEAFNIVRAAYRVGRNQFSPELAGEASTWMLVSGASAFLRGLELGLGRAGADLHRPRFFSRLRLELREQYVEMPGYPLKHFLDIAGSIGMKWVQLSTDE